MLHRRETVVDQQPRADGHPARPDRPCAAIPPVRDRLRTARGVVLGLVISIAMWAVIGLAVAWW